MKREVSTKLSAASSKLLRIMAPISSMVPVQVTLAGCASMMSSLKVISIGDAGTVGFRCGGGVDSQI